MMVPSITIAFNSRPDGRPISHLVFYVVVPTNRNPHTLGPFVSSVDGSYALDSHLLQQLISDERQQCPMDYGEIRADAFQQLNMEIPSMDVFQSHLKAMKLWGSHD